MTLLRDGKEREVSVTLGQRPAERAGAGSEQTPEVKTAPKLGLAFQTLTPDIARQLGFENERGAVIAQVVPGSPADEAGLRQGDLVKEVNRTRVRSAEDFNRRVSSAQSGDSLALSVRRGQNTFFVAINIP
jgi:serine protease Do